MPLVSKKGTLPVRIFHSKLDVGIHLIYVVEYNVHLVFLVMQITSSTYLFHQGGGMGHWGPSGSSSKYFM